MWSKFIAAYLSLDLASFFLQFTLGLVFGTIFLGFLVAYVKCWAPTWLSDRFYPLASKTEAALLSLAFSFFSVYPLIIALSNQFGGDHGARLGVVGGAALCCLVAVVRAIIYKDPHWIVLQPTNFSPQEVFICENDSLIIRFANPASGVTQRLCLASGKRPEQLQEPGTVVAPGRVLHVPFSSRGEYEVMSVENLAMTLRIHITEAPPFRDVNI